MNLKIAVIPGDGVGPEMMEATLCVLGKVVEQYGHRLDLQLVCASGEAIEAYGTPIPEESLKICKSAQAVLLGNTGLKKYYHNPLDRRPEYMLMTLRRELNVTTNIRPVRLYPELIAMSPLKEEIISKGMDILFVRDIVGGILNSKKISKTGNHGQEAYEWEYYNENIVRDTVSHGFEFAKQRRRKVTSLDKANVLASSQLWDQIVREVWKEHPDISMEHYYIDNAAMKLIENPSEFDVIVTTNVFGDIIADEGTQLTGSAKLYASAEIAKDGRGIYTPNQLHDPDETIVGKDIINPVGMIAAAALMLRYSFGLEAEAAAVEQAIASALALGCRTRDIAMGEEWMGTHEMGESIAALIR